jgi:hypothetical protein
LLLHRSLVLRFCGYGCLVSRAGNDKYCARRLIFPRARNDATPIDVVERLHAETNAALDEPTIKARLADAGDTVLRLRVRAQISGNSSPMKPKKWARVVKFAGLKPD